MVDREVLGAVEETAVQAIPAAPAVPAVREALEETEARERLECREIPEMPDPEVTLDHRSHSHGEMAHHFRVYESPKGRSASIFRSASQFPSRRSRFNRNGRFIVSDWPFIFFCWS